jgi:hypothetical protein
MEPAHRLREHRVVGAESDGEDNSVVSDLEFDASDTAAAFSM